MNKALLLAACASGGRIVRPVISKCAYSYISRLPYPVCHRWTFSIDPFTVSGGSDTLLRVELNWCADAAGKTIRYSGWLDYASNPYTPGSTITITCLDGDEDNIKMTFPGYALARFQGQKLGWSQWSEPFYREKYTDPA